MSDRDSNDSANGTPPPFAFPTASDPEKGETVQRSPQPDEDQLDEAIAQSFPASDPVSVTVSPVPHETQETAAKPAPTPSAAWTTALLSSAVLGLGVGAAVMWGRHRAAQRRLAHLPRWLRP